MEVEQDLVNESSDTDTVSEEEQTLDDEEDANQAISDDDDSEELSDEADEELAGNEQEEADTNEEEESEEVKEETVEEVVVETTVTLDQAIKGDWLFYHQEYEDGSFDENILVFNGDGTGWYVTRIYGESYETGELTDMTWANPTTYTIEGDNIHVFEDWRPSVDKVSEYTLTVVSIDDSTMVATEQGVSRNYTKIYDLKRTWK